MKFPLLRVLSLSLLVGAALPACSPRLESTDDGGDGAIADAVSDGAPGDAQRQAPRCPADTPGGATRLEFVEPVTGRHFSRADDTNSEYYGIQVALVRVCVVNDPNRTVTEVEVQSSNTFAFSIGTVRDTPDGRLADLPMGVTLASTGTTNIGIRAQAQGVPSAEIVVSVTGD